MDQMISIGKIDSCKATTCRAGRAFSIIELLVVVAIISILFALTIPAIGSITRSMSLERASQQVADALHLGRGNATTKNRKTEVRFIKKTSASGDVVIQGVQTWTIKDDAGTKIPVNRSVWLPEVVSISVKAELSPILSGSNVQTGTMDVSGQSREYLAVTYLADGSVENVSPDKSFLTIVPVNKLDVTSAPENYRSVYVNPIMGGVRIFRP